MLDRCYCDVSRWRRFGTDRITTSFLDFSRLEHAQDTHEHREQPTTQLGSVSFVDAIIQKPIGNRFSYLHPLTEKSDSVLRCFQWRVWNDCLNSHSLFRCVTLCYKVSPNFKKDYSMWILETYKAMSRASKLFEGNKEKLDTQENTSSRSYTIHSLSLSCPLFFGEIVEVDRRTV